MRPASPGTSSSALPPQLLPGAAVRRAAAAGSPGPAPRASTAACSGSLDRRVAGGVQRHRLVDGRRGESGADGQRQRCWTALQRGRAAAGAPRAGRRWRGSGRPARSGCPRSRVRQRSHTVSGSLGAGVRTPSDAGPPDRGSARPRRCATAAVERRTRPPPRPDQPSAVNTVRSAARWGSPMCTRRHCSTRQPPAGLVLVDRPSGSACRAAGPGSAGGPSSVRGGRGRARGREPRRRGRSGSAAAASWAG